MNCTSAIDLEMGTASSDFPTNTPGFNESPLRPWAPVTEQGERTMGREWGADDSTSGGFLSPVFAKSIDLLLKFKELQPNWDSYGAMPISNEAITATKELFAFLQSKLHDLSSSFFQPYALEPVATVPLDDGGVGVEWSFPGFEIEVLIGPDCKMEYLAVEGSGEGRKYGESDDASKEEILSLFLKAFSN